MKTFFEERNNITSDTLKNKFESVYWQCPDLIIHIELNFRYIYLKNQKEIDKYFESKKDFVIKQTNVSSQMIIEKYEKNQRGVLQAASNYSKENLLLIRIWTNIE